MENIIYVNISPIAEHRIYEPQFLSITNAAVFGCSHSRNLSFYLGYCSKEEFEVRVIPIREAMKKYNLTVKTLWKIPGFKEFFADNNSVVSKEQIAEKFGEDIAALAFSLQSPPSCYPDLIVFGKMFQLSNAGYQGRFVFDNKEYTFTIDGNAYNYPYVIDGKICFWNWNENDTDYALDFARYIEGQLPKGVTVCTEPLSVFDVYDQWIGERKPVVEVIDEIFKSMEQRGYLSKYIFKAENYQSIWSYYTGKYDDSVGLYLCNPKAFKDRLLINRINALLEACSIEYDEEDNPRYGSLVDASTGTICIEQPHYYLQDECDKTYVSKEPGKFGGHYKLKIYGHLDCSSAARFITKGQYIRHRVFFKDEATAIAAGYRPCGVCMKEEYIEWKKKNEINGPQKDK